MRKGLLLWIVVLGISNGVVAQNAVPNYDELEARFSKTTLTKKDSLSFAVSAESDINYFMSLVRAYISLGDSSADMKGIFQTNIRQLMDQETRYIDPVNANGPAYPWANCSIMLENLSAYDAIAHVAEKTKVPDPTHFITYRFKGKTSILWVSADLKRVEKKFGKETKIVWDVVISTIRVSS